MSFTNTGSYSPPTRGKMGCCDLESNFVDTFERADQSSIEELRKPWNSSSSIDSFETEGRRIVPPYEQRNHNIDKEGNDIMLNIKDHDLKKDDNTINSASHSALDSAGAGGKSVVLINDEKVATCISSSYRRRAFKSSTNVDKYPMSTSQPPRVVSSPDREVKSSLPSQYLQDITMTSPSQPCLVGGKLSPNNAGTCRMNQNKSIFSNKDVVMSGILLKKSKVFDYWRRRFVVFNSESGRLEWYKRRANYIGEEPTNCIIRILPSTKLWQKPNSTQFTLQNSAYEVTFDATTRDELMRWLEPLCGAFRQVLQRAQNPRAPDILKIMSQPSRLSHAAWYEEEEDIDDHLEEEGSWH